MGPFTLKQRHKLRYLGVKSLRIMIMLICTSGALYTIDILKDKDNISRWVVPVQIIQILYLVSVIYFIINTGELLVYLVSEVNKENHRLQHRNLHSKLVH